MNMKQRYSLKQQVLAMAILCAGTVVTTQARTYIYQEPAQLRIDPYDGLWINKFNSMSTWSTSRGRMDMQYISRGMIRDIYNVATTSERAQISAFLKTQTVVLDYLDPVFSTEIRKNTNGYDALVNDIEHLYATNGVVTAIINMQSLMSKGKAGYLMSDRVDDAKYFANYVNAELAARGIPAVDFSLTDASRALNHSDWAARISLWVQHMRSIGEEPDHILHDFPATYVVDQDRPADLKQAMTYCLGTLNVDSGWWICSGDSSLDPAQARNKIMAAINKLQTVTGWSGVTKYVMWGDFKYNFHSDAPDTVNGAPYTALEVFNEIYNDIL